MVIIRNQGDQATDGEGGQTLKVNMSGESFIITPVMPQTRTNEKVSFVVPEPGQGHASECSWMNHLERQNFGGFSAIKLELRNGGKYKAGGQKNLTKTFDSALDLVDH